MTYNKIYKVIYTNIRGGGSTTQPYQNPPNYIYINRIATVGESEFYLTDGLWKRIDDHATPSGDAGYQFNIQKIAQLNKNEVKLIDGKMERYDSNNRPIPETLHIEEIWGEDLNSMKGLSSAAKDMLIAYFEKMGTHLQDVVSNNVQFQNPSGPNLTAPSHVITSTHLNNLENQRGGGIALTTNQGIAQIIRNSLVIAIEAAETHPVNQEIITVEFDKIDSLLNPESQGIISKIGIQSLMFDNATTYENGFKRGCIGLRLIYIIAKFQEDPNNQNIYNRAIKVVRNYDNLVNNWQRTTLDKHGHSLIDLDLTITNPKNYNYYWNNTHTFSESDNNQDAWKLAFDKAKIYLYGEDSENVAPDIKNLQIEEKEALPLVYEDPNVVYEDPNVVYEDPNVVYQNPNVVYQDPNVVQYRGGGELIEEKIKLQNYLKELKQLI